jgi:hypothetical protein
MYNLETTGRPGISMLGGHDPACAGVLYAFHNSLGRPECRLTYGESFSLHIPKGQSLMDALLSAADALDKDFTSAPSPTREHVTALLANL